jgi:kinesin family protein 1
VILGDFHVFRFNDPQAVRLERQRLSGTPGTPGNRSDSPNKTNDEFMDWSAARREVADIEKLGDQDLDKLYDDIVSLHLRGFG